MSQLTNVFFPICSLTISIFLCCIFFMKKNVNNRETRIYSWLLICGLMESFLYTFICFTGDFFFNQSTYQYYVVLNKVLCFIYVAWMTLLFYYIFGISEKITISTREKVKKLLILIDSIAVFLILINNVDLMLDVTTKLSNATGTSINILYFLCAAFLIAMVVALLGNLRNKEDAKKFIPYYVLFILFTVSLVIRVIDPYFNITSNIFSLVLLVMYHTIENPDIKMIEQLNMAKEQAEKANRAKTDFLSSMSHEIRTPLNAIVGFSQCIQETRTLDEAKENATDVISASSTLLEIVNSVLDISKIEAGKLEIVNSSYDAYKLFNDVAKLVSPKMVEKAIDFQIDIASDLPKTLYGDHANLKKVITNLLSNASKYTEKGYVKYVVRCVTNNNICRIMISVEDSGRGIKTENIDRLFNKFQRLEEDRNTTIEGTGLGLAITKRILELMGGKIVVQSIYGSGSKFTVVVDQVIDVSNAILSDRVECENESRKTDFSNMRFLIVDDNRLNLKVATKIITSLHPVSIETVESGFDCICKINSGEEYDLIFMDDMMPKMSGVETLQKLKEFDGFAIPVIALTANAIAGMRDKYLNDGFTEYLAKPIDKKELENVLGNIFKGKSQMNKVTKNKKQEKIELGELPRDLFEFSDNDVSQSQANEVVNSKDMVTAETMVMTVEDLKKAGIDVDHGLELLGDMDMYNDTMTDFMNEFDSRLIKIKEYKDVNDMSNYAILVHALKSDSKYLGFTELANLAFEHEMKSKDNNIEYVNNNFDKLMEEANRILEIGKMYVKSRIF